MLDENDFSFVYVYEYLSFYAGGIGKAERKNVTRASFPALTFVLPMTLLRPVKRLLERPTERAR